MSAMRHAAALILALLLPAAPGAPGAEASPAAPRPGPVAVIDVQAVLNGHAQFKRVQAELKADVARAEERIKTEQEEIRKLAEGLKGLLPGTRDYLDLQADVNKRAEELKTRVELQKAEFLQREARAFHDVYREIVAEVGKYAAENGIEVVLRTSVLEKAETPQQILQDINKQVVWFAPGRDITPAILERVNGKEE